MGMIEVGAAVFVGAIFGGLGGAIAAWIYQIRLDSLEARINRIHNQLMSGAGHEAKAQYSEEMELVLAEAAKITQAEEPQDEKNKKLMALALQHPRVALKVAKKLGIDLKGIL